MDLDLDELRATRILNGVEKKDKRISEKQAIKELTEIKELVEEDLKYKDYEVTATLDQIDLESLVIVLNLLDKQKKIINLMAEQLAGIAIWDNKKEEPLILVDKEEVIEHYKERCK
jgi:hypothetical protein